MKTLALFEIDGVLTHSSRACAVAKQALRLLDWGISFVTSRPPERAAESLAFLADRIKASQFPKTAPAYWCGRDTPRNTTAAKIQTFQSLLRQHHDLQRLLVYESDRTVLDAYESIIAARGQPRSFSFYLIVGKDPHADAGLNPVLVYSSAVHENESQE